MIRVMLVDDQALVRAGLVRILSIADGFDVVAECADGAAAVEAGAGLQLDLVVMDIRMPRMDGIQATRGLRAGGQPLPVLVLTTFDEDEVLWSVVEAGASGFVLKDAGADDIIAAARVVAGGGAWFDPAVAPRMLAAYRSTAAPGRRDSGRLETLTAREREVLRLLAQGLVNSEIGGVLHVSEGTVKSHIGAIFAKLAVRDRAAAVVFAFDHGVVSPGWR